MQRGLERYGYDLVFSIGGGCECMLYLPKYFHKLFTRLSIPIFKKCNQLLLFREEIPFHKWF